MGCKHGKNIWRNIMNLLNTIETTIKWAVPVSMIIIAGGVFIRFKIHDVFGI